MNAGPPTETRASDAAPPRDETPLRKAYLSIRSVLRWSAAATLFFTVCPVLILMGAFIDPRKNDWPQRALFRNVVRFAGARLEVRRSPGFDPTRTCFLVSNHVNLFDPFVLYSSIPQFFRGLELESHFRIPVYGWLMKRFGNVPVPDVARPADLKRMWRLTRASLDSGISLLVFPEGGRTLTGRVAEFQEGPFRMALQFGTPIVPVSIVGSFEFNRKTNWMLRPAKIVVYLHDVIETAGLDKRDAAKISERVHEIVAAPVNAHIAHMAHRPTDNPCGGGQSVQKTREAGH
jgi:1-acyl-sn-glycerol-3-phosphate acyltransferase